jgi:hypothetical protein
MDIRDSGNLLTGKFNKKHIHAALGHYSDMLTELQVGNWEQCIGKGGKFTEAVLKALWVHVGQTPQTGRQFKADTILTGLGNLPAASTDDSIRLTIPRACRFVYDVASNRGGRHDPGEINPNEMDASAMAPVCSWILAEMIRYAQKGSVDMDQARDLVRALSARRYPLIEEVDGRVYFHHKNLSARDVAILALAYRFPKRVHESDLLNTIRRHGFKQSNAQVAVARLKGMTDDDGHGNLRSLSTGLQLADQIMGQ